MNSTTDDRPPPKRLVFDRRYGWVLDEWRDPAEAALEGGRGMFCILPLAKALIGAASQSLNYVATSTVKALENPELFSPQVLHATLTDKLKSSIPNPDFSSLGVKEKPASIAITSSSNPQTDSSGKA